MSISDAIRKKSGSVLNMYFTAGFPHLDSTGKTLQALESHGADLIELGLPYSDPLADGQTIQESSSIALKNGITLDTIFHQVKEVQVATPIIAMGYYNQILQYGTEAFLQQCHEAGIAGLIIPDLPMDIYEKELQSLFDRYEVGIAFLITPETSEERIRQADRLSNTFIYMISKTGITGKKEDLESSQAAYFDRIKAMNLSNPRLIGFGIHDHHTYQMACKYSDGAIIGSAYIRALKSSTQSIEETTKSFINNIRTL